jgi:hypothetical protein
VETERTMAEADVEIIRRHYEVNARNWPSVAC